LPLRDGAFTIPLVPLADPPPPPVSCAASQVPKA
jgi:hypothetical protein